MLITLVVVAVTAVIWLGFLDVPLAVRRGGATAPGERSSASCLPALLGAASAAPSSRRSAHSSARSSGSSSLEPICWVLLGLLDLDGVSDYLPAASLGSVVDSTRRRLCRSSGSRRAGVWPGPRLRARCSRVLRTSRRDIT